MKKEEKVIDCSFNNQGNFILINIHEYFTFKNSDGLYSSCYLHKEDVLFVLNTFRKVGKEGYDKWGGVKERIDHCEGDRVKIDIQHGNDKGSYGFAEIIIRNEKGFGSINFQYDVDDPMNPDDSLYKFLMELEKFVPEEDKDKIIPQWR